MAEPHVISGLKAKRARIAGEIIHAQEIVARHTKELLAIDAVILLFSPDCDPEMIAPIRPTSRGLFFGYKELTRLCMSILREAKGPLTLGSIIDRVVATKGFPDDGKLRRRIYEITRASLLRMERKGITRRILDQPDTWWELVRGS
jgi:hypothetical protein